MRKQCQPTTLTPSRIRKNYSSKIERFDREINSILNSTERAVVSLYKSREQIFENRVYMLMHKSEDEM